MRTTEMTHPITSEAEMHRREAAFHDEWAAGTELEDVLVRECFEAPTALENKFILSLMGDLRGKKVLDIGSGLGESSVYLALQGAKVTTTDISPQMVQTVLALGKKFGVEMEGIVSSGESLNVPEDTFDFIYVANTIHHIQDRDQLFIQMKRTLKLGGKFFSFDPLAYNPAINVYRRMATEVRTPDEAPLTTADVKLARKYFADVRHREFWIAGLMLFVKYYAMDRLHPNADRYWKRIFRETPGGLWWWQPLGALDAILTRLPLVKWLSWNMVMWGTKELAPAAWGCSHTGVGQESNQSG
jgi:SAM-dependent methyltransferase